MRVKTGSLVAVVGPVGCGKSSLISAALKEMVTVSGSVHVKGQRAYVPQQAWCQNATLQDNVLFGERMNPPRYGLILEACALLPDLNVLPAGDLTEIGEKGINLSGGQKQRISLARAVYQDCDIYFLDDPLSAVDSHVGKHLFENVIGPHGILRDKTRILVTHSLTFLPQMDHIIVLHEGRISEEGTYQQLVEKNGAFAEFLRIHSDKMKGGSDSSNGQTSDEQDVEVAKPPSSTKGSVSSKRPTSRSGGAALSSRPNRKLGPGVSGQLITEEYMEQGQVKASNFILYIRSATISIVIGLALSYLLYIAASIGANIWLSYWSTMNDAMQRMTRKVDPQVGFYLGIYGLFGVGQVVFVLWGNLALAYGTYHASTSMHNNLLSSILRCPITFFDTTPLGRILNRFSRDIDTIDANIPLAVRLWLRAVTSVFSSLIVIVIASPWIMAGLVPLMVIYYAIQQCYVSASRQLKRIESISRSPIYSHFQDTIVGVSSVRAYKKQLQFIGKSDKLNDDNQVVVYLNNASNLWLGLRLETIGNIIILLAGVFAITSREGVGLGAGLASLSITYALQITGSLSLIVRMACDLENYAVSIERIAEYSKLKYEAEWVTDVRPPVNWPTQGVIEFRNYSVRYRPGLNLVLRNLSFKVNAGEKVGIVGRTGAGKSSITLALFRILEPSNGSIVIDDVDISCIGLHDIRRRITIIPQDPIIFSGTLRMNLDPFDEHSDAEIWTSLDQAHLRQYVASQPGGLECQLAEGGENMSVGQRQLLCLARALLRKTKILILDEATAAIDLETDDLIQETIREEFRHCTIVTIAHRINTIMDYDRVMVLEDGSIREFGKPSELIQNERSQFYSMAKNSNLV